MSAPTPPPPVTVAWPAPLTPNERRVLGVLVEKAKTTPDAYPMSINALVTGSNQKSNRDPLMTLNDLDVEEALGSVQQKGLVMKVIGGRVERWRHLLYEKWQVDKVELAILGELLLRGPQTEGELRTRASRMEPIDDLDTLRARLKPLAQRRMVVYLSPEGRRGTMLSHGFYFPKELERLRGQHAGGAPGLEGDESAPRPAAAPAEPSPVREDRLAALESRVAEAFAEIGKLSAQVAELRQQLAERPAAVPVPDVAGQVAELAQQLKTLKEALGA
jgi:uncharacterized protein YceH (UPF0502 family)